MILWSADNLLKAVCSQIPSAWMAVRKKATQSTLRGLNSELIHPISSATFCGQTNQTQSRFKGKQKTVLFVRRSYELGIVKNIDSEANSAISAQIYIYCCRSWKYSFRFENIHLGLKIESKPDIKAGEKCNETVCVFIMSNFWDPMDLYCNSSTRISLYVVT